MCEGKLLVEVGEELLGLRRVLKLLEELVQVRFEVGMLLGEVLEVLLLLVC